jgi:hypothetical protein
MDYQPYQPGGPQADAERVRQWTLKRFVWLMVLIGVCVGPPAVYYAKRFFPWTPKPPLAVIDLPDGKQVRLVGTFEGPEWILRGGETFGGRLVGARVQSGSAATKQCRHGKGATCWLVLSVYDPKRNLFDEANELLDFEIVERFVFTPKRIDTPDELPPVTLLAFTAIPRRSASLQVRFNYRGRLVEASLPNPFVRADAPSFAAESLPQSKTVEGVQFDLKRVRLNKLLRVEAEVAAHEQGKPANMFPVRLQYFDPTGNETVLGVLPPTDRVWGIRATATTDARFIHTEFYFERPQLPEE